MQAVPDVFLNFINWPTFPLIYVFGAASWRAAQPGILTKRYRLTYPINIVAALVSFSDNTTRDTEPLDDVLVSPSKCLIPIRQDIKLLMRWCEILYLV